MRNSWDVAEEDVAIVLSRNNLRLNPAQVFADHFVGNATNVGRVEWAAIGYSDIDDQYNNALDEIEVILIEEGVIPPKR